MHTISPKKDLSRRLSLCEKDISIMEEMEITRKPIDMLNL